MTLPAQAEEVPQAIGPDLEDSGPTSYVLPFVAEVHKQSYGDFRKYARARKWSRAFRSIGKQLDQPPTGLMPGTGPVYQTWQDQMRDDLAELPAEGRRAFRLFYDAKARKLLKDAAEASEEQRPLLWRRLASSYFVTTSGDDAACLLARHAMDRGRPREAAELLRAVLDHHPDTDRDRLIVWLDYARAHAAAHNTSGLQEAADYIEGRYAGATVRDGGADRPLEDVLAAIMKPLAAKVTDAPRTVEKLYIDGRPLTWDVDLTKIRRGAKRLTALFSGRAARSSQKGPKKVPAAIIVNDHLWLNDSGQVIVLDLGAGTRVMRKGTRASASNWQPLPRSILLPLPDGRVLASDTPTVTGRRNQGGHVLPLTCWDADQRTRLWRTHMRKDTKGLGFLGDPVVDGGAILCAATKGGSRELHLVALALEDGELLWEVDLGTPAGRSTSMGWGGSTVPDLPAVVVDGSWAYVMGDGGAVVAVDRDAKAIGWAMRHDITSTRGNMYGNQVQPSCGSVRFVDGILYFRASSSKFLYALDVRRREVLWKRPVNDNPAPSIVGIDDELIYLLGRKIRAHRRDRGVLVWTLPSETNARRPKIIVGEDTIYIMTRAGLFERAKIHGGARQTLNHKALATSGGHVLLHGDALICVSADRVCRIEVGETYVPKQTNRDRDTENKPKGAPKKTAKTGGN